MTDERAPEGTKPEPAVPTSPAPHHTAPSPRLHLPRPIRHLVARPRLSLAVGVFLGLAFGLPWVVSWRLPTILLVAWNAAAGLHLMLMMGLMASSDETSTLSRARRLDEGAFAILALSATAGLAGLLAILAELAVVKELTGFARISHIGLAGLTVFTAWSFIHVMFALHYAHDWTLDRAAGRLPGLRIPGEANPDYWDFLYVAVVIGTSGQTADVEFTSKRMRRIGLVHCTLAFFFNATVLALTINIAASLV